MIGMRRRLDAVDADMLPVLWLPDCLTLLLPKKVRADDPGLGCSVLTWETWSRVWSASNRQIPNMYLGADSILAMVIM